MAQVESSDQRDGALRRKCVIILRVPASEEWLFQPLFFLFFGKKKVIVEMY